MSNRNNATSVIDIELDSNISNIVEKCQIIKNKNSLYIEVKKPEKNIVVIATIKQNYTVFRNEIRKFLKDKEVAESDCKRVLNFMDEKYTVIYPDDDNNIANEETIDGKDNSKTNQENDQYDQYDPKKIKVVIVSECLKLHSGRVKVSGNIVGRTEPYKVISEIMTSCGCSNDDSESRIKQFNPPLFKLKEPYPCSKCDKKLKVESIIHQNAITIKLQDSEKYDEIDNLTCILLDTDFENIKVGEKVSVTGDIHIKSKFTKELLVTIVYSDQLEYEQRNKIALTEIDIQAIKKFARLKEVEIIKVLVDMFDTSIIGNKIAKEALLYSLVSIGDDLEDIRKHKKRTRINVVLAGDPGHAKSSLIKKTVSLVSNARYESVKHSSAKSLTAIVVKEDEQPLLKYGPLPMSRGSMCGLNEIGAMNPEDQIHLYDIAEEGEFTLNKLGINAKIKSPTTIVATTNLLDESYTGQYNLRYPNTNADKISLNQIPLQGALLDRMDLIVVIKENGNIDELRYYVEKKTELQSTDTPNYDEFLRKYIEFARKINPTLSPEATKMIQDYYINLIDKNNLKSKRVLETIFRLCKTISKLRLKNVVDADDVIYATRFYNILISKYLDSLPPIPQDPAKAVMESCKDILKSRKTDDSMTLTDLIKQVCKENENYRSYLLGSNVIQAENMNDELFKLTNNKKIRRIKELLQRDSNIITVNKSPIKLSYQQKNNDNTLPTRVI